MATLLFNEIIFGPVISRRLGKSLGINLLPTDSKFCNFDCIYCECGLTKKKSIKNSVLPSKKEIKESLEKKLIELSAKASIIDAITFAGNGEPTLHPEFSSIVDDVIELRNKFYSNAIIAVLTNGSYIKNEKIFKALLKIDKNIIKIDSGYIETIKLLNRPHKNFTIDECIDNARKFEGNCIIQTMFVKGILNGKYIDNSTDDEINEWIKVIKSINPKEVMIYTIDRATPYEGLQKVGRERLIQIAEKVEKIGIKTHISF
jgi:wyosine [tRNA(Phe)-imidazoG37] synthetase (radical SAM superfamily)